MEFSEKLQELRKSRSLTQEELAEELYVSRTAISKWESGRGYPSIDSLKAISRFFGVTIDELICPEEMLSVAETEKKEFSRTYLSLLCNTLDIFQVLLVFLPVFGNGTDTPTTATLFELTGTASWIRVLFAAVIGLSVLNGVCGVILSRFDDPVRNRHRLITGFALSVTGTVLFLLTRQPYAGILCFALLVIKGFLMSRTEDGRKEEAQ